MGEEFYCILKLVSGEEVLSLIMVDENDDDPIIILQNPVVMKSIYEKNSVYIKIKPWMELSNEDIFFIKLDKVITMTETTDKKLINLYQQYLCNDDSMEVYKPSGEVRISEQNGYISSVEDARKKLEELYKGLKES
jgi:hypothetical protein